LVSKRKRSDLDAVLFTKYSTPIRARDLHRAAQLDTWGPGADDTCYYLNDELVNCWFKMLNTKLDERAFAGTREKNVCQENMQQRPSTARNGRDLQLAAKIKNRACRTCTYSIAFGRFLHLFHCI
jgi:hypothetical protein